MFVHSEEYAHHTHTHIIAYIIYDHTYCDTSYNHTCLHTYMHIHVLTCEYTK